MSSTTQAAPTVESSAGLAAELQEDVKQTREIKAHAEQLVAGLADEAFLWRPAPERWSVSECLVHLNTTAEKYLAAIDQAIRDARSRGQFGDSSHHRGFLGRWMLGLIEPPPKRRFKAPKAFVPAMAQPLSEAAPRFMSLQDEILDRIGQANGLDLWRAKVRSPALPLLRFSLGETFAIVLSHERRHLWQADQVRRAPGFPSP